MQHRNALKCIGATLLSLYGADVLAAEASGKRPNILFCIADDASWMSMSAYGCTYVRTPSFDRLAREGILFRNCFTTNPKCSPSRATLLLEELGELDNTLIVATADNGMPFPRVKGQVYDDDFHLPLAIRWGRASKGGRVVGDFISFSDMAPTFLEAAGLSPLAEMTGRSFLQVLIASGSGQIDPRRDRIIVGKERHDIGRPGDVGYPVRAIRTRQYLYVRNFKPDRWPAGNPETGYTNVDDSPTKRLLLEQHDTGNDRYYKLSTGKRPAEELYDLAKDPHCMENLAGDAKLAQIKTQLWEEMRAVLVAQKDPRILGNGAIFDSYQYVGPKGHSWDAVMGKKQP